MQPSLDIDSGRWTREEHLTFIKGLEMYGKGWKKIAGLIKTRTVVQIRTHAQKYFLKLSKARQNGESCLSLGKGFGNMMRKKKLRKKRPDRPLAVAPPLLPFVKHAVVTSKSSSNLAAATASGATTTTSSSDHSGTSSSAVVAGKSDSAANATASATASTVAGESNGGTTATEVVSHEPDADSTLYNFLSPRIGTVSQYPSIVNLSDGAAATANPVPPEDAPASMVVKVEGGLKSNSTAAGKAKAGAVQSLPMSKSCPAIAGVATAAGNNIQVKEEHSTTAANTNSNKTSKSKINCKVEGGIGTDVGRCEGDSSHGPATGTLPTAASFTTMTMVEKTTLNKEDRTLPQWYSRCEHVGSLLELAEGLDWSTDVAASFASSASSSSSSSASSASAAGSADGQGMVSSEDDGSETMKTAAENTTGTTTVTQLRKRLRNSSNGNNSNNNSSGSSSTRSNRSKSSSNSEHVKDSAYDADGGTSSDSGDSFGKKTRFAESTSVAASRSSSSSSSSSASYSYSSSASSPTSAAAVSGNKAVFVVQSSSDYGGGLEHDATMQHLLKSNSSHVRVVKHERTSSDEDLLDNPNTL